jgi:NADPH-dependent 2,4-dienoyl-CoA reductase/sulfur reductase-like enzyme
MAYSTLRNGTTKSGEASKTTDKRLRILIVGAGIGGLVAAIALRQQGHKALVRTISLLGVPHHADEMI